MTFHQHFFSTMTETDGFFWTRVFRESKEKYIRPKFYNKVSGKGGGSKKTSMYKKESLLSLGYLSD